ncbi:MAG: phosphoribosylanthranilate isomerase [Deltaproteobacteria bacterium]|nr:phosphoribosylanthranilate isomerase [Deltaproteobacteria bacterium]
MRTRVKVCGLTRRDDALLAADLGADALGFVFAPGTKRPVDPEVVARVVEELPPFVAAVGVFRNQPVNEVRRLVRGCGLHLAQLHGDEDPAYIRALGLPVLKAVGIVGPADLDRLGRYPGLTAFLLDAPGGGTGRTIDWGLAREARRYGRIVLAGGLTPENVAEAIRTVRPWAVDAASGTEARPGVKDPDRLRRFLEAVRAADAGCPTPPASPS